MNAVGFIDKQVLPLDDAWFVEYDFSWVLVLLKTYIKK